MHEYQRKIKFLMDKLIHLQYLGVSVSLVKKISGRKVKHTELEKCLDYLGERHISFLST